MSNIVTTGRIPLWLIGTLVGTAALGILSIFFLWIICWFRFFVIRKKKGSV